METIEFEILGEPQALKRHRTFRRGNFTGQYDPSKGDKQDFLALAHAHAPEKPIDVPVRLTAIFYFGRPKSHYRTGKNAGVLKDNAPVYHVSRPDIDNLFKFIADSLNQVFWRDDSMICSVISEKRYSENPKTVVKIEQVEKDCEMAL